MASFERDLRMMGYCAFCAHHTHDFPAWDEHYQRLHDEGWHVCELDGAVRRNKWHCRHFELAANVHVSR